MLRSDHGVGSLRAGPAPLPEPRDLPAVGAEVRTPVWFCRHRRPALCLHRRRLRQDQAPAAVPRARIAPSDMRGNVRDEWRDASARYRHRCRRDRARPPGDADKCWLAVRPDAILHSRLTGRIRDGPGSSSRIEGPPPAARDSASCSPSGGSSGTPSHAFPDPAMRFSNFLFPASMDPARTVGSSTRPRARPASATTLGWRCSGWRSITSTVSAPMWTRITFAAACRREHRAHPSRIRRGPDVAPPSRPHWLRADGADRQSSAARRLLVGARARCHAYNVHDYQGYGIDPPKPRAPPRGQRRSTDQGLDHQELRALGSSGACACRSCAPPLCGAASAHHPPPARRGSDAGDARAAGLARPHERPGPMR